MELVATYRSRRTSRRQDGDPVRRRARRNPHRRAAGAPDQPREVLDSCARLLASACAPYLSKPDAVPDDPALAWLVDNFSQLRIGIRETREIVSRRYYRALPITGAWDEPDVRRIARQLVEQRDATLDAEAVTSHFEEAQRTTPLVLAELWAIAPMLRLALFEQLRDVLAEMGGREHQPESTTADVAVRSIVTRLHDLDELPWREVTESLSALDAILRADPSGVYPTMDFETRDVYRRVVERIARGSEASEEEIAHLALELARLDGPTTDYQLPTTNHVGYYLAGPGLPMLEKEAGLRKGLYARLRAAIARRPALLHLGGAGLLTLAMLAAIDRWLGAPWWYLALLAIPASEAAISIANTIAHTLVGPRRLPRLDFSDGVADDCRTLVVVPALLLSRDTIATLLERLEVHYLSARDPNMFFALLTDCADSREPNDDDEELGGLCAEGIRRLNDRYSSSGRPFYLFHRARTWNPAEGAWMGHERKRGKLNALNAWLLGGPDLFSIKAGDPEALNDLRYVITLDADTRMPVNAARELVATAAHPLNRPVFDDATNTVREGYAILQPRVGVSAESASRSRLSRLRSGAAGVDPYATAVSDVYQDLYDRASFTGKGLYDLAAFHRALDGRFPDGALLSHDLIEGEHCRVGLVTDIEFIDDYPGSYQVYSKRKHRWTRGDWQLLYWLLPRVPTAGGRWVRNPLSGLSRWKILDNLRRSALDIVLASAVIFAWLALGERATAGVLAAIALIVAPAYAGVAVAMRRLPHRRFLPAYLREKAVDLARAHREAFVSLGLALHQGALMADAIVRTLVRRFITRRHLLQWETMAQAESAARPSLLEGSQAPAGKRVPVTTPYLALTSAAAAALLLAQGWRHPAAGALVAVMWLTAPLLVAWLNGSGSKPYAWRAPDVAFARGLALRTWTYFSDHAEDNGLVPDNVQETPERVAHQASPTNIGLQLASTLAASDFGYVTAREFATGGGRLLETIERLDRCRGHFYNWYDTRTLEPLAPLYVSTVDSGNLCAALLAVAQGCEDLRTRAVLNADILAGIRDHGLRLRNALPRRLRGRAITRSITAALRRLETEPADAFAWATLISEVRVPVVAAHEWLRMVLAEQAGVPHSTAQTERFREACDWAGRLVDRLDAASRELRRYAPWVDAPGGLDLPADALEFLGRVPTVATSEAHYDVIERQMRAAGMNAAYWRQANRVLLHVGRARLEARHTDCALRDLAGGCRRIVEDTDFAFLFDRRRKLLHIGYSPASDTLDPSYYDLLASEARTAVLLAIAKHDIPPEAWFHLGRKLTSQDGHRVLVSWGGTMFEHLMPALFTRTYDGSLLDASTRATVAIQMAHAREHRVPWGFSEAAHAGRDYAERYQYRTFGVPAVAMRKMADSDLVVAPYAAMLAMMSAPGEAIENLRLMASKGWIGRHGFYESIDYTARGGGRRRRRGALVRAFMAHHQGMSLLAMDNALLGDRMQARFHADPLVAAAERLLQERVPTRLPVDEFAVDRRSASAPVVDITMPVRSRRTAPATDMARKTAASAPAAWSLLGAVAFGRRR